MPICQYCGKDIVQCQCSTVHPEDIFYAVNGIHRYKAESTEPEQDDFFTPDVANTLEETDNFDYLDFNNDWED